MYQLDVPQFPLGRMNSIAGSRGTTFSPLAAPRAPLILGRPLICGPLPRETHPPFCSVNYYRACTRRGVLVAGYEATFSTYSLIPAPRPHLAHPQTGAVLFYAPPIASPSFEGAKGGRRYRLIAAEAEGLSRSNARMRTRARCGLSLGFVEVWGD